MTITKLNFELPPVISQPLVTPSLYLYGVVPTTDQLIFETPGLDGEEVWSIQHGDLALIVSNSTRSDVRQLTRQEAASLLLAHQRVIEAAMHELPILPIRFGTLLPDEIRAQRLLEQGGDRLRKAFQQLAGCTQYEVLVLWDLNRVFAQIAEEPVIAALKAQIATLPAEASVEGRVTIGRLVKQALERRRSDLQTILHPCLAEVAIDLIANPLMDDSMVLNVALLMDKAGYTALEQRLDTLDATYATSAIPLQFRLVGPLAPYSFASVEAYVPSFEAIEEARSLLGLDVLSDTAALRRAYHRHATELHPDYYPNIADAEARMAALTRAYRLLLAYAQTDSTLDMRRKTVETTVMVTVQRQES